MVWGVDNIKTGVRSLGRGQECTLWQAKAGPAPGCVPMVGGLERGRLHEGGAMARSERAMGTVLGGYLYAPESSCPVQA